MEPLAVERRVAEAVDIVKRTLDVERNPRLASGVNHEYNDKYLLAEYVTNTSVASVLQVLELMGLNESALRTMHEWAQTSAVTLALDATECCAFDRMETRKEESKTQHVREYKVGIFSGSSKSKVVTKIDEWFWDFTARGRLYAYPGTRRGESIDVFCWEGEAELKTTTDVMPFDANRVMAPIELELTWLLQQLGPDLAARFRIDRAAPTCRTPYRNEPVQQAVVAMRSVGRFLAAASAYAERVMSIEEDAAMDLGVVRRWPQFAACLPLFEERVRGTGAEGEAAECSDTSPVLSQEDANRLLAEERRLCEQHRSAIEKTFGEAEEAVATATGEEGGEKEEEKEKKKKKKDGKEADGKKKEKEGKQKGTKKGLPRLISAPLANFASLCLHGEYLTTVMHESVEFIEQMLYRQLTASIGRVLTSDDFAAYMEFHNRKLFRATFAPSLFSHAVRRAGHDPEGVLSLTSRAAADSEADAQPVVTASRSEFGAAPMHFQLDAATRVFFRGERHVHGYMSHAFASEPPRAFTLTARAKQFSSFMVLVGRIAGPGRFEPSHAVVVQNKDEFLMPLLFETIPSAKEFADAIASLSPEQQRFAQAFRSMQLESTLFAVCVIQIKPQLEKLLRLAEDSLTKEIQLTQELIELFLKYHIPSDLLSFQGAESASAAEKLRVVEGHVRKIQAVVAEHKAEELRIAEEKEAMRQAELRRKQEEEELRMRKEREEIRYRQVEKKKQSFGGGLLNMVRSAFSGRAEECFAVDKSLARQSVAPVEAARVAEAAPADAAPDVPADAKPDVSSSPNVLRDSNVSVMEMGEDYTELPGAIDARLKQLDGEGAVRPTIIKVGQSWTKHYQRSLLSDPETRSLDVEAQAAEKKQCFDLLDALTRSGSLEIEEAALHVFVGFTHAFDKALVDCVVQDNVNPIEKVEKSVLIVASEIHGVAPAKMLKKAEASRVRQFSPELFE